MGERSLSCFLGQLVASSSTGMKGPRWLSKFGLCLLSHSKSCLIVFGTLVMKSLEGVLNLLVSCVFWQFLKYFINPLLKVMAQGMLK